MERVVHERHTKVHKMAIHRFVIGFSVRQHPELLDRTVAPCRCELLKTPAMRFAQPLTLKWDVWDAVASEQFDFDRNGTNLMTISDTFGVGVAHPKTSCLIAVDMDGKAALRNEEKYGLVLAPVGLLRRSPYWTLLGYDIVSLGALVSGLYGYNWSDGSSETGDKYPVVCGNSYGLIGDLESAKILEDYLNKEPPEDFPFYAVGVWIKHRSDDAVLIAL